MAKYVSSVELEINGQLIDDFAEITEPEVEYAKPVELMNKTGSTDVTPRYIGGKLKYVVPSDAPEFDFTALVDGVLTIVYKNGTRRRYIGVTRTKIGGESYKDKNETVRDIEFMAEDRDPK